MGYLKKDSWISKIEDLIFWKNKTSLLVNIEGANSEITNKQTNKNKNFQMRFFTFCYQILSISTIGANIGSCPRTTLPLPHGFFHLAPLSRVATSHWARAIVFYHLWSFRSWLPSIIEGANCQRNSEDRNAPITAGENHPITAEHKVS